MDETPEELERIRREADAIDPYKYRRRTRALAAIGVGAVSAGIVWVVVEAYDKARNPCERVRAHLCQKDPASLACKSYTEIAAESERDPNPMMRSNIRGQCVTKIERLKAEEGSHVP